MKLLLASTSGGHFSTMRSLKDFWFQHKRVWITDFKQDTEVLIEEQETVHWLPYQGPRDLLAFLKNVPAVIKIIIKEKPDLVVSTGASIAVSFAIIAKLLGIPFIYIESISRFHDLSLSGKLVYHFSQEFYVQWSNLCDKYPKAIYKGVV
ncbi:UDP-N-acetylglucosamine--LPS N-acetylglucosamine transferase [Phormidium sp. LEGE 05292]|uniref:PssD/Cps14F family polysaccharide biosynthesis glycosyltransferase n=1 Tax=[Phormidium] sp. LEGE 05292 TaxID=767427 RepID=UPI00187F1167|nr:PssD/Cps14F family polysaccharide biosynthesis glycosyltransferase [Phormidium sp. LEGE 05292]MBE9226060.1 UDP-N-acetylglucosamine--LPS N-acetylglucosamine transferase [Phormidium sp. LEGE 05292]